MSKFINTIDLLGDDAVIDSIIDRSITEFKDNIVSSIGGYAFTYCNELKEVDCPNAETLGPYAFGNCTNLITANLANAKTVDVCAFEYCTNLATVNVPNVTTMEGGIFKSCTNLVKADFPKLTQLKYGAFENAKKLETLIIRNTENVCGANSNENLKGTKIASGGGYIYVPAALVDSYMANTYWSPYASRFRALEDYTVDGTTTGELDPTKI